MKIEFVSSIWHENNADGDLRTPRCIGCWHFVMDDQDPIRVYAICNECNEIRFAAFPGIENAAAPLPS